MLYGKNAHRLLTGAGLVVASSIVVAETATEEQSAKTVAALEMDTMVVTATREAKPKNQLAESIDVVGAGEIESVSPSHPAEVLNRIAGVHINNLGGEGHMSAIRQPITTGGVYLFLEDGVPTRPTGFFNHNGLYEINLPQADRIEVTKGPGSALYGSDAIGGVINSITKPAPEETELDLNGEAGAHGWKRGLLSAGGALSDNLRARLDLNVTDNDGYRDASEYSRYATTLRLDGDLSDVVNHKTILSYSEIDQSGVSGLEEADYQNRPETNLYHGDIGYRQVEALRLSSEWSWQLDQQQLLTLTPFIRDNQMQMMPSWMITYDPNIRDYQFQSYGLLAKYRRHLTAINGLFIVGLDTDYTPSEYVEEQISVIQMEGIYTDYQRTGVSNYDFEADQTSISPYVHFEYVPVKALRLSAGLRYDYFDVDYNNRLAATSEGAHLRPDSQTLSFDHWSPKLGAVYQFDAQHNVYANYRHAFRAPSVGQLFRPGSNANSVDLKPVQSDSFEVGLRGKVGQGFNYEVAVYHMTVEDDIVSFIDGSDRKTTNAGETEHKGIEVSWAARFSPQWLLQMAVSYSKQEYKDFQYIFQCFPPACIPTVRETRNFSGFEVGKAPATTGNLSLQYQPAYWANSQFELEWQHMGDYFTDETNTAEYGGHDLFNLRAKKRFSDAVEVYARLMNVADKRYSSYTSNQVGDADIQYRPGLPRSLYVGVRASF